MIKPFFVIEDHFFTIFSVFHKYFTIEGGSISMQNTGKKRRGPWIDGILISSILALITVIAFFSILDGDFKFQKKEASADGNEIKSNVTEADSAFPGIRIISDMSNDNISPFAIQYPQTNDENFNQLITEYIIASKKSYIKTMKLKQNIDKKNTVPGELNIHFDTYQFNEKYYSFVFTNRMSANDNEVTTSIKTIFYNIESKEILTIHSLLGEDDLNLETFSTHVRSVIEANKDLQPVLLKDNMLLATEARWVLYDKFAIRENDLVLYFDEGTIAQKEYGPVSIPISLSFLNPILDVEFQIKMVDVENANGVIDDHRKRVALTFDDGPHPKVTMQVLQCLDKYNAKATFFMLGNRVQYYPEIAKEVSARGHEIGNHTWSHPVLTKLSNAQIMSEFTTTEEAIFASIGHESTVFRPPYGATNETINDMLPRPVVNWTVDTLDWKHRDQNKLLPMVKSNMHNNAIILMHDIHQSTADGLDAVLAYLSSEGYEFVTVSEIMQYHQ